MTQVRAKKHLGQHFLKDLQVAQRIAESLELTQPTPVLEIGPGMGVLTQFLLKDPLVELTAVELDTESVGYGYSFHAIIFKSFLALFITPGTLLYFIFYSFLLIKSDYLYHYCRFWRKKKKSSHLQNANFAGEGKNVLDF